MIIREVRMPSNEEGDKHPHGLKPYYYKLTGDREPCSQQNHPVSADDETFDGILQDLLDAGWELNNLTIFVYVPWTS
jgi:hypothetical protein